MTDPRPRPRATKLVREHYREVLALEREELASLRSIYERARLEILARLADVPAERFSAQHLQVSLVQIDAGLAAMSRRLDEQGVRTVRRALREGLMQTLEEIAQYEPKFAGMASAIRLDTLRRIAEPENLLLNRYDASIARFSAELRGDVQRRLGVHLVRRSFMREVVQDIAGKLEASAISGATYKAERIVRTEMISAMNSGHQAALETAAEVLPGLQRQWDATLDARTSSICRSLNGQIRGLHEMFVGDGGEFASPPAHPNCRSRVVPWRAEWADLEPQPVERATPPERTGLLGDKPERSASRRRAMAETEKLASDLAKVRSLAAELPPGHQAKLADELGDLGALVDRAQATTRRRSRRA